MSDPAGQGLLRVDLPAHEAWYGDRELDLSPLLYRLLVELARHEGAVVTMAQLHANVWNGKRGGPTKTIVSHVSHLRRRIGDEGVIRTVTNVGYALARGVLAAPIVDPLPVSDRVQALDLAQVLRDSIASLEASVHTRAAELASARIAAIRRRAEQRVAELERALAVERQRREDLGAELRRQVLALEQQLERAREGVGGGG